MSIIGGFLLAKGTEFALGQAKKAVQNKVLEVAKTKAGEAIFGKQVTEAGDLDPDGKVDFRGLQRFKAPRPSGLVKVFCGGSVITGDDLDGKLRDQAIKAFNVEQKAVLPEVKRNEDGEVPAVERQVLGEEDGNAAEEPAAEGPAPKDAKVEKPVNRPISIEDFRSMVTVEQQGAKRAKNKGYVRFVKCDGGNGVTLGKVANKVNALMSWRVNVTKEHNRQMRLLFAETMLADFGGINGVGVEGDNTVYGAALQSQLAEIRTRILNNAHPGDLLKRTVVRDCLEKYDAIFGRESLSRVADSFMNECLRQCGFSSDSVEKFLAEYGKYAPEGLQTRDQLKALVTGVQIRDGKALKAALATIAEAFGKMNEVWQQDKAACGFLGAISANPTTAREVVPQGRNLDRLRGALLRRMAPENGAQPNNAEVVNLFFEKAFSPIVDSLRLDFQTEKESGVSEEDRLFKFAARLSLESILAEVVTFGQAIRESASPDARVSPMRVVIQHKEQAKAAVIAKLEACQGKDPDLVAKLTRIKEDIAWLERQEADFKEGKVKLSDEFRQEMEKKALADGADVELKRSWSKDGLMAVLVEGAKSLDAAFQRDYAVQTYLKRRCENISYQFNGTVKDIMDGVVAKFEDAMRLALAANVRDHGDISPQELIAEFADFLMFDVDVRELRGDEALKFDGNPNAAIKNARHTAPMLFVEGMMRTAVNLAITKKAAGGAKFAEQVKTLKAQTGNLAKVLAKLFVSVKKEKLVGLTRFVNDLTSYRYKGVGDEASVKARREMFLQGARQLIFVKLMTQFIESDLPDLLAETRVDRFTTATAHRLDLRVEEAMSAFLASSVQQFYEGTLHFATTVDDLQAGRNALNGIDVRDPETGYTNPADVAKRYQAVSGEFDVLARLGDPELKRTTYRPIADKDLAGAFTRHAEQVWRQNVVSHVPGRHWFNFIDGFISLLQDVFKVTVENRKVDISGAWLDHRANDFRKEMDAFVARYASFEARFVNACRAEVAKALEATGDRRFTAVRDPAVREHLVDDVLGRFNGEIAEVLQAFIANPKAYANTGIDAPGFFGGDARLVELVRDVLGLALRGDVDKVTETEGGRKIADALNNVIQYRRNLVNGFLDGEKNKGYVSTLVMEAVLTAPDTRSCSALKGCWRLAAHRTLVPKAASALVDWVVDRTISFAKANPVDVCEVEGTAFYRKLVDRILSDLDAISDRFVDNLSTLVDRMDEVLANAGLDKKNTKLQDFVVGERTRLLHDFIGSYVELALARTKKSEYAVKFEELVVGTANRFKSCIEGAKKLNDGIYDGFFKDATPTFGLAQREGEAKLSAHGATADTLLAFNRRCNEIWASLPERLNKSLASLTDGEYQINTAVVGVNHEIQDEIAKLADDYADRLDAAAVNFNAEGVEKLLAAHGVSRADCPDGAAFDAAVKMLLDDPVVVDLFVKVQKSVLESPVAGGIKSSDASFVEVNVKPVFTFQYKLLAARHRVDAQIAAVHERLAAVAAERNAPEGALGGVRGPLVRQMDDVRRRLDVKTSVADFDEAVSLRPDDVNLDVEKLVAAATERLDKLLAARQLENARAAWLDANFDRIATRVFKMASAAFDANLNEGAHAKEAAVIQRQALVGILRDDLTANVLMNGDKADWDKAMDGILSGPADVALSEKECARISPRLLKAVEDARSALVAAQAQDAVEREIADEIATIESRVNKRLIIAHMPSWSDENKDNDYNRLLARDPSFADPVLAAKGYGDRYGNLDDKAKKTLPEPKLVEKVGEELAAARSAQLQALRTRLLDDAKKNRYDRGDKATDERVKELLATLNTQIKARAKGKAAFEAMLKFMRVPRS